ncbi:MAG TPA: proprotein convertase P-domain-containing protein, partial [Herpetosiphonaceae bacterium]|nr:proprotein convertase P-domain-containing protein [Herpetosiphonaceae bacterium]
DQYLDDLSPRLMQQLQYRRVGDTESLWVTQTISATGRTALRWYEIRDFAGATPTVFQQSTYTPPDGVWRWMGSIAADKDGNAAIGYSASSPQMKPGVWYSGRLVTDPPNTLAQGDGVIKNGDGNPTTTNSRWGDYSIMTVDPVDDCTFWYQNEYYKAADMALGTNRWSTAIGAFKFPSCTPLPATGIISGTVTNAATSARLPNMPISVVSSDGTRIYAGSTDANGVFQIRALPGTYTVTAGPQAPAYLASASVGGIVVTSNATAIANITLNATPNLVRSLVTIDDTGAGTGNGNNALEPGEQAKLTVFLENTGLATATGINATLVSLTPGVRVINSTAAYPTIAPTALGGNLTPFTIRVDALRCGETLKFRLDVTTAQRSFSITFELPTGTPGAVRTFSSTGGAVTIPIGTAAGADVAVGAEKSVTVNQAFAIADVNVTVTITHPFDADIQAHITSPSGQEVELTSDNGGSGANYTNTVFDDNAATPVTAGAAPFTGSFRPEGSLADLNGTWANGVWTLHVYDDSRTTNNTPGQLGNFTLSLRAYECAFAIPNLTVNAASASEAGGNGNRNGQIDPGESPISMTVDLLNSGIPNLAAATGVTAIVTPANSTVHMINKTSAYPDIPINGTRRNLTPYTFSLDAQHVCGVPLDFTMTAFTVKGTSYTDMFSVPTGGNPVATQALSNTVENGAAGWTTTANLPSIGWAISPESAHSPTRAWSDSPGADYVASADVSLISPILDFSAYDTVSLRFWHTYDLESEFDYGYVEYSTDGGATWTEAPGGVFTGDVDTGDAQTAWAQATLSIPGLAHATNGRVRFHLVADTNVQYDGWHIDDISVSGAKRSCKASNRLLYLPFIIR